MCKCDLDYIDLAYKAKVWDATIAEAQGLGLLDESGADVMRQRNPFRRDES